jgi:hypothetical protein
VHGLDALPPELRQVLNRRTRRVGRAFAGHFCAHLSLRNAASSVARKKKDDSAGESLTLVFKVPTQKKAKKKKANLKPQTQKWKWKRWRKEMGQTNGRPGSDVELKKEEKNQTKNKIFLLKKGLFKLV